MRAHEAYGYVPGSASGIYDVAFAPKDGQPVESVTRKKPTFSPGIESTLPYYESFFDRQTLLAL
jgi:hypothetical protein